MHYLPGILDSYYGLGIIEQAVNEMAVHIGGKTIGQAI